MKSFKINLGLLVLSMVLLIVGTSGIFAQENSTKANDNTSKHLRELYSGTRFSKDANGIITDRQTGLQWLEGPDQDIEWKDGQKWIVRLGNAWRTPEISELKSLFVQNAGGSASKNLDPLFVTAAHYVWSVKGIDTGSIFFPQKAYCYYNFDVRDDGQSGTTKGCTEGTRVFAVRNAK